MRFNHFAHRPLRYGHALRVALATSNSFPVPLSQRIGEHALHSTVFRFKGHLLYGISNVVVYADQLESVVDDCAKASRSSDARDKYFLAKVSQFDASPAKELSKELPALEAAKASLAAAAAELAAAVPDIDNCKGGNLAQGTADALRLTTFTAKDLPFGTSANLADEVIGMDVFGMDALLKEARDSILVLRGALA